MWPCLGLECFDQFKSPDRSTPFGERAQPVRGAGPRPPHTEVDGESPGQRGKPIRADNGVDACSDGFGWSPPGGPAESCPPVPGYRQSPKVTKGSRPWRGRLRGGHGQHPSFATHPTTSACSRSKARSRQLGGTVGMPGSSGTRVSRAAYHPNNPIEPPMPTL